MDTTTAPTHTIENATWAGAEVYRWTGPDGVLVATLGLMPDDGEACWARMESTGRRLPGPFASPDAALAAVAAADRAGR